MLTRILLLSSLILSIAPCSDQELIDEFLNSLCSRQQSSFSQEDPMIFLANRELYHELRQIQDYRLKSLVIKPVLLGEIANLKHQKALNELRLKLHENKEIVYVFNKQPDYEVSISKLQEILEVVNSFTAN